MVHSRSVVIGGVSQWLYVHRTPRAKHTLFFLHGGPGWSDAPLAHLICRHLWSSFNLVHWDQRGSNRSHDPHANPPDLTIQRLVQDGIEVAEILKREYGIGKPILVGHSWGTVLGILMTQKAPEGFGGYVGIGQLVANATSEPLSLALARESSIACGRTDLFAELETMGDDFYRDIPRLYRQREIVAEVGGEFKNPVSDEEYASWMAAAPKEYRSDLETIYRGCEFSMEQLWPELIQIDLNQRIKSIALPVLLICGRHDGCTPGSPTETWFENLKSASKKLSWFENSAHWPQLEENEKFAVLMEQWVKENIPDSI